MITRRLASRRLVKHGSTAEQPARRWAARLIIGSLIVGAATGSAAWLEAWPFASTQTIVKDALGSNGPNEVGAQAIFLPVEPKQETVDVYATPPPAPPAQVAPPAQGESAASGGEHETETGDGGEHGDH